MSLADKSKSSWFAVWTWSWRINGASIISTVVLIVFGLIGYGVAYKWNVSYWLYNRIDPETLAITTHKEPAVYCMPELLPPKYDNLRIEFLFILFQPAYQVDLWWRPGLWAPQSTSWDSATTRERKDALSELTRPKFIGWKRTLASR